jgi:hypothetical protein
VSYQPDRILAFGSNSERLLAMARPHRISPRFDPENLARLTAAAAAVGLTATRWLHRVAMLHLEPTAALPQTASPAILPPLPDPSPGSLDRPTGTRLTPDQHAAVAERAHACGLSVSAYVRLLVLGGTPVARRSEVRSAIVAVNRVGGNLNQVVKLANSGIVLAPDLLREVSAVRAEIGALREAFLAALRGDTEDPGR